MVVLLLALQAIGGGNPAGGSAVPASCMVAGCDVDEPVLGWREARIRFEPVRLPAVALRPGALPVTDSDPVSATAAVAIAETATSLAAGRISGSADSGRLAGRRPDDEVAGGQLYEYSDGFYARLALHRLASYGTLPLFVAQYFAGEELLRNVDHAAGWARAIHGPAAAGVAVLFLVNTVTGGMNMVEGIRDPADRGRRTVHSVLMLIADAGFVWTGVTASGAGRYKPDSNELRTLHRKVALGSMGVATLGYAIMIPPLRK